MTYTDVLSYINNQLKFGIKPGLERTRALLCALGDPHKKCKFIHVAGTNGKGSTCAMIASGLQAAGKKTGLFTSPYIVDFRERMQINGQMIEPECLAELTQTAKDAIEKINQSDEMTEFELITCIAFLWFAQQKCDVVVLETGLGGRLDSTNVIENPLCACITRIDYDHTAVLGDTIEQIASEKAGIFKPGCPSIVSSDQYPAALDTLAQAAKKINSPLTIARPAQKIESGVFGGRLKYDGHEFGIKLAGDHQLANAAVAVEALKLLYVPYDAIRQGLATAFLPARLQVISENPLVILDGAHNPNGASSLAKAISEYLPDKKNIGIMGILADKKSDEMIRVLAPKFSKIYTVDGFSDRAIPADELAKMVLIYCPVLPMPGIKEAVSLAKNESGNDGAVIICGSLYLAGNFLIENGKLKMEN